MITDDGMLQRYLAEWRAAVKNWRNVWLPTAPRTQSLYDDGLWARGNISNLTACRYAWSDGRSERTYHGCQSFQAAKVLSVLENILLNSHGARKVLTIHGP